MFRSASTVEMLKPIALVAGFAIVLWTIGIPSLSFAEAANVTNFSDVLSDSAPSAESNHTISFIAPNAVAAGETMVLNFPAGFSLTGITEDDVDLDIAGSPALTDTSASGATWGVGISGQQITITSGTGTINGTSTITIRIGTNAVDSGTGSQQINNPAAEGSYPISLSGGTMTDSGETRVVILTAVTVTASVNTIFNFSVSGLASATVNGESTTGSTGSTSIPFGVLQPDTASSAAQLLTVSTNAANGYSVTVQTDQPFQSSTGAIIDGFDNGSDAASPVAWGTPDGTIGSPQTYGHWGVTSDDSDVFSVANTFIAASTSPREIMTHSGPVNGVGVGQGTTSVLYKVQITSLQEAGDDYTTTLTYVATPTF